MKPFLEAALRVKFYFWAYLASVLQTNNYSMDLLPKNSLELAQTLGIAVMVLFSLIIVSTILFLLMKSYMASETQKWETREAHTAGVYKDMVSQVAGARDKDMELLRSALEDNREQISIIRGVLERQKQSDQALRDIFRQLSSILQDRCRHHFNHNQALAQPTTKTP